MNVVTGVQVLSHVSFSLTHHYPRSKHDNPILYDFLRAWDAAAHYYFWQSRKNMPLLRKVHCVYFVLHLLKFIVKDTHTVRSLNVLSWLESFVYTNSYYNVYHESFYVSLMYASVLYASMRNYGLVW